MWVYASSRTALVCVRVYACAHWPCAWCVCMCVFWVIRVTGLSFLWCGWRVILSCLCHVLWNMLAAFVVTLPVLLFWHFHTMVHLNTVMLLTTYISAQPLSAGQASARGGLKSSSICCITFRPAQSTVNWDAFKHKLFPIIGKYSLNTSSGLDVRWLKKLFSYLMYPWTLWGSTSPQKCYLKPFYEKQETT